MRSRSITSRTASAVFDPTTLIYLTADEIHELHDAIIDTLGGLAGVRLAGAAESIVARITSNIQYREYNDIAEIAALYADAIVNGHLFNDGNKRTGLAAMTQFLDVNGYAVRADEIGMADQMVALATHAIDQRILAEWLRPRIIEL